VEEAKMAMQDRWCRKVWTLNYAEPSQLNDVLLVKNGLTQFSLQPFRDGADVVGYNVTFEPGRMTEAWDPPCRFYRFGIDAPPAPTPPPQLPLPPWDSTNPQIVQDYYTVATSIQGSCRNRPVWVERLQGEIHVAGRPELVTLYKVDGLIQGGGAFLYIDVLAEQAPDVMHIQQSGLAHGND
jgi:hypothetical protein